jgi:hypothetical protein
MPATAHVETRPTPLALHTPTVNDEDVATRKGCPWC